MHVAPTDLIAVAPTGTEADPEIKISLLGPRVWFVGYLSDAAAQFLDVQLGAIMQTPQIVLIDLNRIKSPNGSGQSDEGMTELASSMRVQGLLHPIGVRTNPENPEKKLIVFGRGRFTAAKQLHWEQIECKDFGEISDEEAEFHMMAENLHRKILPRHIRSRYEQKWAAYYLASHPDAANGAAGSKAAARAAAVRRGESVTDVPDAPKPPSVVEAIVAMSGAPPGRVKDDLRLAEAFNDEQFKAVDEAGVTTRDAKAIIKATKDKPAARQEIVDLTVSQHLSPAEAIATVIGNSACPGIAKDVDEVATKAESEMSDEQKVDILCADVLAKLTYQDVYRQAAEVYYRTMDARMAYRKATRKTLLAVKSAGLDPYSRLIYRATFLVGPQNWLVCGSCSGTGTRNGQRCDPCWGNAFTIPTEQLK